MDEELLELQRQFESAQQAKSSIRLSERNVVELVQKLRQLNIIDFDLLHTVSGKEYITPEHLRIEIVSEIKKLGRVSLIDLADIVGVDLYHVEKQAQIVVADDSLLMLINGEIISDWYWNNVCEEINDRLQECSQIALAEIAAQLQVGSELLVTVLEPRLGTRIKGRLEGGQLYTPAYVARVNAMVRGAARGITVPMNLSALWGSLQLLLQEMDGASGVAVEGSFFQSMFNGLVKEGQVLGSVRAGVHWTPSVFAIAQKECVDSFFSQNSVVSYEALHKLGITQPIQFLQSRYPEGIPLVTLFVHPSTVEMLDAAVEDAIERGSWIDSLSVLPASFGPQDAHKMLSLCPSVQTTLKANKALILGDSYVFSTGFVKDLYERMEKDLDTINFSGPSSTGLADDWHVTKVAKSGQETSGAPADFNDTSSESGSNKQAADRGSKRKKGKPNINSKAGAVDNSSDNQEPVPAKSKKNQRKGKVASSSLGPDSKSNAKKDVDKIKEESLGIFSEEELCQKITELVPDFEEQGIDSETVLVPLASHLRPMLLNAWNERRKAALTDNGQKIKRLLDNLQKKLDESSLNMQLYEKGLDLFEDNPSTLALLHRHLLRTTAAPMVDMLLSNMDMLNKLKNGLDIQDTDNPESISLTSGDRIALAKKFDGPLSVKAIAVIEALEGKDLSAQVSAETDPVAILPKVVSLLYIQFYARALQAPGRTISVAISKLKDKLDDSAYKTLEEYHAATVTLLTLISASTGDEEDCTSDRTLSKKELLERLMPALKALVSRPSQ
ncbi:E3 UFM1-protein ligase 1 homolog isoform X2 [Cynara cardunculus var. scolymus]|uniref:E3 UFM1-protein ligase 1 homolog isoform X2 n=1 Tax=Cynara cardunculus var. scolymus TaxID=59895 RepID=UPI000D62A7B7|nr:E3 UFM1-protein ligase 1 homolog isoform X2 [Cynara cardunculus var. scolymus]